MKNTGITREADNAGRIVLCAKGIADGPALEISVDGRNIVLSPMAKLLTRKDLVKHELKPVFAKCKEAHGAKEWLVVCSVTAWGVLSTGGKEYRFADFDFYDREVWE